MASTFVRPAAVAGMFYSDDSGVLASQVHTLLSEGQREEIPIPKALVVPHAGYMYSGSVAASAYRLIEPLRAMIRRVILLGPTHRVAVRGMAVPASSGFETPLGNVEIDQEALEAAVSLPGVCVDERAHAQEHSLEVQLPFLQSVLDHFRVLPVALGAVAPHQVAELLETLWGGDETLVVISSDLSHYHPYRQAQKKDRETIEMIMGMRPALSPEQACGCAGVNGLLLAAQNHHLAPHLLDLRNSGDTAGDRSRVVGYASLAFSPQERTSH